MREGGEKILCVRELFLKIGSNKEKFLSKPDEKKKYKHIGKGWIDGWLEGMTTFVTSLSTCWGQLGEKRLCVFNYSHLIIIICIHKLSKVGNLNWGWLEGSPYQ